MVDAHAPVPFLRAPLAKNWHQYILRINQRSHIYPLGIKENRWPDDIGLGYILISSRNAFYHLVIQKVLEVPCLNQESLTNIIYFRLRAYTFCMNAFFCIIAYDYQMYQK